MSFLSAEVSEIFIDTYPEAAREDLPMFAENRIHQRTSGNPYPNKVVLKAQRKIRTKEKYTLIKLENEYLEIGILPALGGKIWYAKDKKKGYNFFYKNNVVKPALIGAIGSWTSGGLEFNWPFHHRASAFMPVDYYVERNEEEITVWLSEHDPIDRMKGMVGISLRSGECIFTTKTKLDNITHTRKSFLWWENTAVPVNEDYEIFFPEDVNYVRFHYKRSVTTYPVANTTKLGAFNGIYYNEDNDISKHKNTRRATSYFSAESKYDYFGGYDNGKKAGVVHIADHNISPGKKMFTWAYDQLAKTWENALTDNDGQYAELMAGCYSDNQPDFAWLEPHETKTFSQNWFPVHDMGVPSYANENGALYFCDDKIYFQAVKPINNACIEVIDDNKTVLSVTANIPCYDVFEIASIKKKIGLTVNITLGVKKILSYSIEEKKNREIPLPRKELPYFKKRETAQDLYLEGVHIEQYRSPDYSAEMCYEEALERDPKHIPSLTLLAEKYINRGDEENAAVYIDRAEKAVTEFNTRCESGKIYYLKALVMCMKGNFDEAYSYFYKSAWSYDCKMSAYLYIGLIDIRRRDLERAIYHLEKSMSFGVNSVIAPAMLAYAYYLFGDLGKSDRVLEYATRTDRINIFALAVKALINNDCSILFGCMNTDITQNVMDISEIFAISGLYNEISALIKEAEKFGPLGAIANYTYAVINNEKAYVSDVGIAFPSRYFEKYVLKKYVQNYPTDHYACYLLGCLLYGKKLYDEGIGCFEKSLEIKEEYYTLRALAIANYSVYNDKNKALELLRRASMISPPDELQITFETVYVMGKACVPPMEIVDFLQNRSCDRDDITVELAKAYNRLNMPEEAIKILLSRNFVAFEGGEHYIADQYMYAHYLIGKKEYESQNYISALETFRSAQILPQSLGSGLWNPLKKLPYQYFEAMCLYKLGEKEEADKILEKFKEFYFDYFTNMYLPTYAYYLGRAYELLGEKEKGIEIVTEKLLSLEESLDKETLGYYGTTPFFISYIENNDIAKELSCAYPLYLYSCFLDNGKSLRYKESMNKDGYTLYIEDFTK